MYVTRNSAPARRGVILLVVLSMLTLFAIVGISFVFYSDAAANASRIQREAEVVGRADVDPELAFAFIMSQLIYDVNDDETGIGSALRGYSFARGVYGFNYAINTNGSFTLAANSAAFTGTGRLSYPVAVPGTGLNPQPDNRSLVNFLYHPLDGFLRDPERYGFRNGPRAAGQADNRGPFVGEANVPYTYADGNNLYLAVLDPRSGGVLQRSFHRDYLGFGPLDPANPNWKSTDPAVKYMVMRPHPSYHKNFPLPEDAGGDVKNLPWSPGFVVVDPVTKRATYAANDSFWMDVGAPVMTTPEGRKFKMLVAPLILDFDGLLNVNVHGNVRGWDPNNNATLGNPHRSNMGFGPWEVNLGKALPLPVQGGVQAEWSQLFLGRNNPRVVGKYGPDQLPDLSGTRALPGRAPHFYGQVDYDASASINGQGGGLTGPVVMPNGNPAGGGLLSAFPTFPAGYDNGSDNERRDHPLRYNVFAPIAPNAATAFGQYDRRFGANNMERLWRYGDTGTESLTSELEQLLTENFFRDPVMGPFRRRLLTTDSADRDAPGVAPYVFDRTLLPMQVLPNAADQAPVGQGVPFPNIPAPPGPLPAIPAGSDFGGDWRTVVSTILNRIDLSRPLAPYPLVDANGVQTPATYNQRFDANANVQTAFVQAQTQRQQLARDIYNRLLANAAFPPPVNPAKPTADELRPRRYLAQLAVNIVDFMDEDDISTPFNFYTDQDNGGNPLDPTGFYGGKDPAGQDDLELPRYWVFGIELPHVVLNEVLVEFQTPNAPGPVPTRFWVELYNPFQTPAAPAPNSPQQQDGYPVPLYVPGPGGAAGYAPFKVVIANTNPTPGGPLAPRPNGPGLDNDNVLGKPEAVRAQTVDVDFANPVNNVAGNRQPNLFTNQVVSPYVDVAGGGSGSPFFLIGPKTNPQDARATIKPAIVPAATPWLQTDNMVFTAPWAGNPLAPNPDDRKTGFTVLLRRLANPHLPFNPNPVINVPGAAPTPNPLYNPYVTIDYLEAIQPHPTNDNAAIYASRGKDQPYASFYNVLNPLINSTVHAQAPNPVPPGVNTLHTFGKQNLPLPQRQVYDWLVHLDRQLVSPMELLHVSGLHPHQLTHYFMQGEQADKRFQHRAHWFDEPGNPPATSNRLYRLFEHLDFQTRANGNPNNGRITGRINLNAIRAEEVLQALCDINNPGPNHVTDPTLITRIYQQLVKLRDQDPTGIGIPNANSRPFLSLATGFSPGGVQYPVAGRGINDTILRAADGAGNALNAPRLFQLWNFDPVNPNNVVDPEPDVNPYLKYELLTKIFANTTVRSNVFGIWLTIGFFEVENDTVVPPVLGREIGRDEGRQIRHRMFAIVDRSNLGTFTTTLGADANPVAPGQAQTIQLKATNGFTDGIPWAIQPGSILRLYDQTEFTTPNAPRTDEYVVVQAVGGGGLVTVTAPLLYPHKAATVTVSGQGNPGPQVRYNPKFNPSVVLFSSIID
jgi:hypothetical protein